ncbi:hypothetical protein [Mariniflexile sp.]|uniref:hypothetical protein n=1 Tax=Mariniflexile sp. TaxID=1979402 RepID=UPI0040482D05
MKTLLSSILAFFMTLSMSAQVGVNNPNPEQALDVNGKVKLTNDAIAPSAGTMRYDATSSDFEGYNGTRWNSFTQSRSSGLPSNPVPVYGYSSTPSEFDAVRSVSFGRWEGSSFSQVPTGKYLIVTSIFFQQSGPSPDREYNVTIGPATGVSISSIFNGALVLAGKGLINMVNSDSAQSPIFVLKPGQYLTFSNSTSGGVRINIRGFLVDDLNY